MSNKTLALKLDLEGEDPNERVGKYTDTDAFNVLKDFLDGSEKLSLEDTAYKLWEMLPEDSHSLREPSTEQRYMGYMFVQLARQIPYWHPSQQKLVDLVEMLGKSPRFNQVTTAFSRFPRFHKMASFYEELGERHWHFQNEETNVNQLLNITAFTARLSTSGEDKDICYFLWSMRDMEDADHIPTSTDLKVMALWALCAGQQHFTKIVLYPEPETPVNKQSFQTVRRYKGPIFGRKRWDFWQRYLASLSKGTAFDEEARQLASKAADFMAALSRTLDW